MKIIPAIDLWENKVVRFRRGLSSDSFIYSDKPLEVARQYEREGAELLHLVDLGAALGEGDNLPIIKEILQEVKIDIEVAGGIRDIEKAKKIIDWGAKRIVLGTKAKDENFLKECLSYFGKEKIVVSVDVKDNFISLKGWQEDTKILYGIYLLYLKRCGVRWVNYTDIMRDGTLEGVNIQNLKKLAQFKNINFIFAGGVSSLEDIKLLKKEASFLWGVIIGKALYEGKISLPQALKIA